MRGESQKVLRNVSLLFLMFIFNVFIFSKPLADQVECGRVSDIAISVMVWIYAHCGRKRPANVVTAKEKIAIGREQWEQWWTGQLLPAADDRTHLRHSKPWPDVDTETTRPWSSGADRRQAFGGLCYQSRTARYQRTAPSRSHGMPRCSVSRWQLSFDSWHRNSTSGPAREKFCRDEFLKKLKCRAMGTESYS